MTVAISKLRVPDYDRWAAQFEAGATSREMLGVKVLSFGHDASDRNIAVTIIRMESLEKLQALFANPTLQSNVEKEGIDVLDVTIVEN
jgi:hypothetical protein